MCCRAGSGTGTRCRRSSGSRSASSAALPCRPDLAGTGTLPGPLRLPATRSRIQTWLWRPPLVTRTGARMSACVVVQCCHVHASGDAEREDGCEYRQCRPQAATGTRSGSIGNRARMASGSRLRAFALHSHSNRSVSGFRCTLRVPQHEATRTGSAGWPWLFS